MILASNSVKAFRVAVVPSEFTSNIAEFGAPIIKLVSLNPKEGGGIDKLPAGYTRVGWIAGFGDVLIDTGYYPNHNSEILIDRSGLMDYLIGVSGCGSMRISGGIREGYMVNVITEDSMSAVVYLFGALNSQEQAAITLPIPHGDAGWYPSGGENPFEGYESELAETRYSIYMSKGELRVGTESRPNTAPLASVDPWDVPFTLFGVSVDIDSDVMTQLVPDIIFSFKVSESGVPVVNMLPCVDDATGQPGFYDTVRGVFIAGEGGAFLTGDIPEPKPLPENLYAFNDCTHYSQVSEIYPSYLRKINDWNYYLNNLQIGGDENGSMFMISSDSANPTLKSFNVDLPSLTNGYGMFGICTGLTSFTGNLPALIDGQAMFARTGLTSWDIELPKLTTGYGMFMSCTGLTSFTGNLPYLMTGYFMFAGTGLTSWDIELPNLDNSYYMFSSIKGLTSFTGDLPALTIGNYMFYNCIELTSFTGDLPALIDGEGMFGTNNSNCTKLDLASVQHIANTINDLTSAGKTGKIYIGMDASLVDTEALETALAAIRAKGWTVTEMYRS